MNLPIAINKNNGIPLHLQISKQIRLLIHRGIFKPGHPIPTVRALAVELEINANTVARVYHDLQNEGVLSLKRGIGTFIAKTEQKKIIKESEFTGIEKKANELISLCKKVNISSIELFQLLETRWKESERRRNP
jgi:GntR family transcriptional regulator